MSFVPILDGNVKSRSVIIDGIVTTGVINRTIHRARGSHAKYDGVPFESVSEKHHRRVSHARLPCVLEGRRENVENVRVSGGDECIEPSENAGRHPIFFRAVSRSKRPLDCPPPTSLFPRIRYIVYEISIKLLDCTRHDKYLRANLLSGKMRRQRPIRIP